MTINYEQAKTCLRGMICLNEYEAEAINLAIRAIDTCIENGFIVED